MLDRLFHIAVNSTDLDRSVAFYKRLGFQVLSEREVPSLGRTYHSVVAPPALASPNG